MKGFLTAQDIIDAKAEEQEHLWVKILVQQIEVAVIHGEIATHVSSQNAQSADEDGVEGCWFCDVMLTVEAIGTKCPGPDQKLKSIMPSDDT